MKSVKSNEKKVWIVYKEGPFRGESGFETIAVHQDEKLAKVALANAYLSDINSYLGNNVFDSLCVGKFVLVDQKGDRNA